MQRLRPIRIVILGAGFAGISAAQELSRFAQEDASLDIHLVNQENYFLFQPLLPEVVSGTIEPSHIVNPVRLLCPHVQFHCATVQEIRLAERCVILVGSDVRRTKRLRYDHLILSLGVSVDLAQIPGMAEHSLPLKTLGDAFYLRNQIIRSFEDADLEGDDARRRTALTAVVIGGGFSGVETLGALHRLMRTVARWYPRAQATGYRLTLVHSRDRLLPELDPQLAHVAHAQLKRMGVDLRLNTSVSAATPDGILLSTGERLNAGTVVSTVGNRPHTLIRTLPLPQEDGRLLVGSDLRELHSDHLWAIGDNARVPDSKHGGVCPPTAQYATRQGAQCARNVINALRGDTPTAFSFPGFGQLASLGDYTGVGRLMGVPLSGLAAWVLWRSIYLSKIPGRRKKLQIAMDWISEWLFPRDITVLDIRRTTPLKRAHYRPGDIVFRQGEIGDSFYMIQTGMVEILRENDGGPEQRLGIRTAGESFGEVAIMKGIPRTATVRCLTSVNLIMLNRQDFSTLVGSSHMFRHQIDETLAALTEDLVQTESNAPENL